MKNFLILGMTFTTLGVGIGYTLFHKSTLLSPNLSESPSISLKLEGVQNSEPNLGKLDPAEFLSSFKVEPVAESGKVTGYKITWLKSGSALEKAGLKVGDVIESIGGKEFTGSPTKNAISLLQSLKKR